MRIDSRGCEGTNGNEVEATARISAQDADKSLTRQGEGGGGVKRRWSLKVEGPHGVNRGVGSMPQCLL